MPGLERVEWEIEDPKGRSVDEVRRIRDVLRIRVADLLRERDWHRGECYTFF